MELRPNEERGKLAEVMIWIVLGSYLLCLVSNIFEYNLIQNIIDGGEYYIEELEASDSRQTLLAIVSGIACIASVITFIQWFRRAYYNLHENTDYLSFSEGWAAGAWFVPVLNLFLPYMIMREIYERSTDILESNGFTPNPRMQFIGIWWTFTIIGGVVSRIALVFALTAKDAEEFLTANIIDSVFIIIWIPTSIFTVIVIRNYRKMERMLEEAATIVPSDSTEIISTEPITE